MTRTGTGCDHRVGVCGFEKYIRRGPRVSDRPSDSGPGPGWILLVVAMPSHPQQRLLKITVAGKRRRIQNAVDPPVHHDGDPFGHGAGDADVLLDDQNADISFGAEADQHLLNLAHDQGGEAFGRFVHQQKLGVEQQGPAYGQHLLLAPGKVAPIV